MTILPGSLPSKKTHPTTNRGLYLTRAGAGVKFCEEVEAKTRSSKEAMARLFRFLASLLLASSRFLEISNKNLIEISSEDWYNMA